MVGTQKNSGKQEDVKKLKEAIGTYLENSGKQSYIDLIQNKIKNYKMFLECIPTEEINKICEGIKDNMDVNLGEKPIELYKSLQTMSGKFRNYASTIKCLLELQEQQKRYKI